ncbi:hypothetical protein [Paenibacillus sp. NPDC057967]|uniref:hypothetical protein n=1 Tax=Paenibacillus sp. NPDC057967 TaxID=3346293 RepID=UPI0036D76C1D
MKKIRIVTYFECVRVPGRTDRCEEDALLIAPDIAAMVDITGTCFFRVKPSATGVNCFDDCGMITVLDSMYGSLDELTDLPAGLVGVLNWIDSRQTVLLAAAV